MDAMQLRAIINSKTRANSATKQRDGQAYAIMLGLTPGKSGADDLIDGYGTVADRLIYFQCKLSQESLGSKYADEFYAGLEKSKSQIGIMLAGVGYNSKFLPRLKSYPRIEEGIFVYHLLCLEDIYTGSEKFLLALDDLPPINIENIIRIRFGKIDQELYQIIQPLMQISQKESVKLIMQLSRDELIKTVANLT